ncbi:hypothetical protein [Mesorhizobium sp.]|nr:hypothetical protein [Mesorhizobium sp.]
MTTIMSNDGSLSSAQCQRRREWGSASTFGAFTGPVGTLSTPRIGIVQE